MLLKFVKSIFIVSAFVALVSCQKDFSTVQKSLSITNLNDFFKQTTSNSTQSFTFNTNAGGTIKGKNGSGFTFRPLSFVDLNGNLIRGNVKIDVLEILTPADNILNNAPTTSNGRLLESGGSFYISATYNNSKANLAPGSFVAIDLTLPSASIPGMQVFTGVRQDTGSVNWLQNSSPGNFVFTDSLQGNVVFNRMPKLFSDSLEWINCDKYVNEPKIQCSFPLENNKDKDSTVLFVQYTGRNSVIRIYKDANGNFGSAGLIAGPVTAVGLCMKDGALYSSITTAVLKDKLSVTMRFAEDSEDALKEKLKSLK